MGGYQGLCNNNLISWKLALDQSLFQKEMWMNYLVPATK